MSDYAIAQVRPGDQRLLSQIDKLLAAEGLTRDKNLDHIFAMMDEDDQVIATGSAFGQTLRCFAVDKAHRGEGLLNEIISHLVQLQIQQGNRHLFLYTKAKTAKFFQDLGFYEIARVDGVLAFLENRRRGFPDYLNALKATARPGVCGAVVMNANPFTLGHRYLVETAASQCDTLHLFVLSEDASVVPFAVRKRLVEEGVRDIPNVIVHESGPYIISNATFPSYFLKDDLAVMENHAKLDLAVFTAIARALNVTVRFVGEEPASQVTHCYNAVMARQLPEQGIDCRIIPRKTAKDQVISASTVRTALRDRRWDTLADLVPPSTLEFFRSPEATPVLEAIAKAETLIHH